MEKKKFDLKQSWKLLAGTIVSISLILGGYLVWLNGHVKDYVQHSKFISMNKEVTDLNDFVGGEQNTNKIKNGLFLNSIFNPLYANKEYYIQKEVGVIGFAYDDGDHKVEYGNMVDDKFVPLDVKVISKSDFEVKSDDYTVVDNPNYEKLTDTQEVERYLNAIGIPFEKDKTYYKFIRGKYVEKVAITVDK